MSKAAQKIVIEVDPRTDLGKNACRRLRASGRIPGIVYGLDVPPYAVAVSPRRVEEVLHLESGRNTIFTIAVPGGSESREVMFRDLQRDPVSEKLVHVDFVRVDPKKQIHVRVPVRLVGVPTGVKNEGGLLDFNHREVEVLCLPGAIPEHLDVDISGLHLNQHVSVKDLPVNPDYQILDDPDATIASVAAPRVETVATEAEAAEAAPEAAAAEAAGKEPAGGEG